MAGRAIGGWFCKKCRHDHRFWTKISKAHYDKYNTLTGTHTKKLAKDLLKKGIRY